MEKLLRAAAPLLLVAALVFIALLMLSAKYVASQGHSGVVVYSARIDQLIKPMFDAFTEKTGIQVKYLTAGEKELFENIPSHLRAKDNAWVGLSVLDVAAAGELQAAADRLMDRAGYK